MNTKEMSGKCPMAKNENISDRILVYIRKILKIKYGNEKPLRIFHAKTIGLVQGELKTEKGLPESLRVGLFKQEEPYKIWIRFTNGSPKLSKDINKSARGMAIKVLDVKSSRYLDEDPEGNTQDIILFTNRFFTPGVGTLQPAGVKLALPHFPQFLGAVFTILTRALIDGIRFFFSARIRTPNVLEEMYYSATPYSFGENNAIKWHARPLKTITSVMPKDPEKNFLHDRMKRDLSEDAKEEISFALFIQFHENDNTEPIDDTTVIWKTPFRRVATITVPKQNFDTPERQKKDLDLTYSPGHSIIEHAPLGSVNAIRRRVYKVLAKERLEHKITNS